MDEIHGRSATESSPKDDDGGGNSFYVVGIGGSAGALEVFEQFFAKMPHDTGMAFVLVPHLDPTHKGIMPELLQRYTSMKVFQAQDGLGVYPNTVYVIPPNKDLAMMHGILHLLEPTAPRGLRLPIDFFFRQLADDQKERAIGIIMSGMGSDGSQGLKAIKEQMGMIMVQDPASAKYDAMPRSAVNTGVADFVAPVEELPGMLLSYVKHLSRLQSASPSAAKKANGALQKVLIMLRMKTGNDFSLYKKNTLMRRIDRRMSVHQLATMAQYAGYLQENEQEVELLFKEILIGVTSFFRDPEAFAALEDKALMPLLGSKPSGDSVRVWVPACSTGEETYSIAILLRECIDRLMRTDIKVQVYGTDIDLDAINFARQGVYSANIAADVTPERLQKFFVREDSNYRIKRDIREMVVFAPQNILTDPPFTRLDLLCCRNLLIYLTSEIQKKILPLFHYSLYPGGFMLLGPSETVSGYNDLFAPLESKWKIFRRLESSSALTALPDFPSIYAAPAGVRTLPAVPTAKTAAPSFQEAVQRLIMEKVAPPVLLINDKGDLVYTTRKTGKYLELPVGSAALNVFEMAREGLKMELSLAVHKAATRKTEVRAHGLTVRTNGDYQKVNLTVRQLNDESPLAGLVMVVFEDAPAESRKKRRKSGDDRIADAEDMIAGLEKELRHTKEHLQGTIEEMETSQEEIKSANEELQSTNEELQSTNEELTTSKEELQSLNEELMTLNAELQAKNDEMTLANNDMRNLLNSTQIPTLFLDGNLSIKRFTTQASSIFSLIPGDIGRPITDVSSSLLYDSLLDDVRDVLDSLIFKEAQVQARGDRWYTMRIMPYRTMDNKIDGVVITFNDISEHKRLESSLTESRTKYMESEQRYRALVESLPHFIWTCGPDGSCDFFGPQWPDYSGVREDQMLGFGWGDLIHPDEWPRVRKDWSESMTAGMPFDTVFSVRDAQGGYRRYRVHAAPQRDRDGAIARWFCTGTKMED